MHLFVKILIASVCCSVAVVANAQEGDPIPIPNTSNLRSVNDTTEAEAASSVQEPVYFTETVILREFTFVPDDSEGKCQVRITINDLLAKILKWEPPVGLVQKWEPPGGTTDENEEEEIQRFRPNFFGIWEPPGGIVQEWQPPGAIVATPNDVINIELIAGADSACKAEYLIFATAVNGQRLVLSHRRSLQKLPAIVRGFFRESHVRYAAA